MRWTLAMMAAVYFYAAPVAPHINYLPSFQVEYEVTKPERADCILVAQTIWGEARGCSKTEQAAVAWCILNRVDAGSGSIREVITSPKQFTGWSPGNPVTQEHYDLAEDVINRWMLEKAGVEDVGRVLPIEYRWFTGDGQHNHFRNSYRGGSRWGWGLKSPYEEEQKCETILRSTESSPLATIARNVRSSAGVPVLSSQTFALRSTA